MARKKKPKGWRPDPTYMRDWRKRAGFSRQQAADEADMTHSTVSRYESGEIAYSAYQLEALARLYGCKRGQLLDVDPADVVDEIARLRSALIAYGVDGGDIARVLNIIETFRRVDPKEETPSPDDSQPATPRHEEEPLG